MNFIKTLVLNHVLASASVAAALTGLVAKLDKVIALALRFVPKAVIEKEIDRLDALAKAEVERVAGQTDAPKQ